MTTENKLRKLIEELRERNNDRSIAMNSKETSEYGHTVLVHSYNTTIDIINQLENILK